MHKLKKLLDTDITSSSDQIFFKQIRNALILYSLDSDIFIGEKKKKLEIIL